MSTSAMGETSVVGFPTSSYGNEEEGEIVGSPPGLCQTTTPESTFAEGACQKLRDRPQLPAHNGAVLRPSRVLHRIPYPHCGSRCRVVGRGRSERGHTSRKDTSEKSYWCHREVRPKHRPRGPYRKLQEGPTRGYRPAANGEGRRPSAEEFFLLPQPIDNHAAPLSDSGATTARP